MIKAIRHRLVFGSSNLQIRRKLRLQARQIFLRNILLSIDVCSGYYLVWVFLCEISKRLAFCVGVDLQMQSNLVRLTLDCLAPINANSVLDVVFGYPGWVYTASRAIFSGFEKASHCRLGPGGVVEKLSES